METLYAIFQVFRTPIILLIGVSTAIFINIYLRLKRLLSPKLMGSLFKVVLAYKNKSNNNSF